MEAAPLLADLLASCPQLKILVTSRTALRLSGRARLPGPSPGASGSPVRPPPWQTWRTSKGSRFSSSERTAIDPAFTLTDDECGRRRRDLHPPRWAAAGHRAGRGPNHACWRQPPCAPASTQSPAAADGRSARPARVGCGPCATPLPGATTSCHRHEQALFRRLAVFVGGFTLEAAEHVAAQVPELTPNMGASHPEPVHSVLPTRPSVLELIGALVEQSLLKHEEQP